LAAGALTVDSEEDLKWVQNAGSVFIGKLVVAGAGRLCFRGPNPHACLRVARRASAGGLSRPWIFLKFITVQSYTSDGVLSLGPACSRIGPMAEGLSGHADAVGLRITRAEAAGAARGVSLSSRERPSRARPGRAAHEGSIHPPVAGRDGLAPGLQREHAGLLPACHRSPQADHGPFDSDTFIRERGHGGGCRCGRQLGVAARLKCWLTNGVDEAIHVLCQAFLDRGDAHVAASTDLQHV